MPLQAFNTDANGTMFHNMFSPQILSNKQCYLESQIQTAGTTIGTNFSAINSRFSTVTSNVCGFIPDYQYETLSPPATSTNRRFTLNVNSINTSRIISGTGSAALTAPSIAADGVSSSTSTFVVANSKAIACARFSNSGTALTLLSGTYFYMAGIVEDPLFTKDLSNTRFNNYFYIWTPNSSSFSGLRLANMTTTTSVSFRSSASASNYTFQCSANSGDGTTIGSLWATHLALVDSTAAPSNYCIGTVPPIVLLGRGSYVAGELYKFNNVGEGTTNANAYDRWYIACGQYGTGGDRILMQVYYED